MILQIVLHMITTNDFTCIPLELLISFCIFIFSAFLHFIMGLLWNNQNKKEKQIFRERKERDKKRKEKRREKREERGEVFT